MAPIAITPDNSSTASPPDEGANGYFHSNGSTNGHSNGYANGHSNGYSNGYSNGHSNGHSNGRSNGHSNGATNGFTNGSAFGGSSTGLKPIPIAIVGMACRMPGSVSTPAEFWELCARARTGFTEIPKERFNKGRFHHPNPGKGGTMNPVGGNFLNVDLAAFDAPFFGLTEKEAISMDPQQRLLLECTFEALENAGIPKHSIVGKNVGVFIGGSFPEYESHLFRDSDTIPMHQATGCAYAMQSNRISHFFDLRGPSFTADTACSSSMVAIHLACQSLRAGETNCALVGACHLNMLPEFWISFSTCRLLSDSGRSFAFDERGTGFGRGEGCGVLVLKPLEQAIRDNDSIRAVIASTGLNQDGRTPGITMPSGAAQEALMRKVYREAGLDPNACGFVEAHGTGTRVGDPIEATAIRNVLGQKRTPRDPLWIGSVKSNIGHLEGASGIASIIKAALMLERGFILPNYDFKQPNPKIPWKEWNLKVPVSQRPWPKGKKYISVNNFGFGGTNGHVVLEAPPFIKQKPSNVSGDETPEKAGQGRKLFVFTANDKTALSQVMKNIVVYLEQRPEIFEKDLPANLAYTLGQRRSLLQWRAAIPAVNSFELIEAINGEKFTPGKETEPLRIGFILTGQGAQWPTMGRELYEQYPVFARSIQRADQCLADSGADWSLTYELEQEAGKSQINEAHISQPACTAIQLALIDLLRSWGVRPTAVAGHSSGEIAAAYAAEIIDFESAMTIAYHRGRLIPVLKARYPDLRGRMMAVGGSKEEFAPLLEGLKEKEARIACYNSPSSLTISGDEPAIAELEKICQEKQAFNRRLVVDVAYHSHHMNLVAKEYRASLAHLRPPVPTHIRFHSSLYGHLIDGTELQPNYWVDNLTCPVRFSEALQSMLEPVGEHKHGVNMLVELGPHSGLQGPIKQVLKAVGGSAPKIPYASALIRKRDAVETALELASTLFSKGANLDFAAINFPTPPPKPLVLLTDLPRYPWNYSSKYWQESRMTRMHKNAPGTRSDILGVLANYSSDLEPTWRNIIRLDDLPWLRHHKIQSLTIFPMAGFIAMALEAAAQRAAAKGVSFDRFELKDVSIAKPLVIPDKDVEVTVTLRPYQETLSDAWDRFQICSWSPEQGWTEHCVGLVAALGADENEVDSARKARDAEARLKALFSTIEKPDVAAVTPQAMYNRLAELGVEYGPLFQGMSSCHASDTCAVGKVVVPDVAKEMPNGHLTDDVIQPALLESIIEMYWPLLGAGREDISTVYLPSSVDRVTVSLGAERYLREPGRTLRSACEGEIPSGSPQVVKVNVATLAGDEGFDTIISLEGLAISPILDSETEANVDAPRELCYKLEWDPIFQAPDEPGQHQFPKDTQVVIIHEDTSFQSLVAMSLANSLEKATEKLPDFGTLDTADSEGKICIFLNELEQPLLSTLSPARFETLKKHLTSAQGVLWVVRGAYDKSTNPDVNMITGLSRTIRSETAMKFATLDLDAEAQLPEPETSNAIMRVFGFVFGSDSSATGELEFMERAGAFFTPRIVHDIEMNNYVHKQTNPHALEPTEFGSDNRALRMEMSTAGALDTIHFVDDPAVEQPLGADEIEIEVKAIGLNFRDGMAAKGSVPLSSSGIEASGVVTETGAEVTGLLPGDRVAVFTKGAFATRARTRECLAFRIPADISFEAAASMPLAYATAYYGLVELGRLGSEETVLIHSAAGAVGQAAICIAQMVGANVFATVGTAEKKELLIREYGLEEDQVFYSRGSYFADGIRRATNGQGVDVVLNSLTGEGLSESWKCVSKFGRFVDIGNREGPRSRIEVAGPDSNASFFSLNMPALIDERPQLVKRLVIDIARSLKQKKIKPATPITAFPISQVQDALSAQQAGKTLGKLVVVPSPTDIVKASKSRKSKTLLRPDATYLLIGGTGGLGRSMARWMVAKGARTIVLVSRSGSMSGRVKELADEVATVGAKIIVRRCNVVNKAEVDELINSGLSDLPPVRGVVHGTMVLRDVLFEKMTWEDYSQVIEGKVHGGWNLHLALEDKPLDFFVAISSAAGAVGNRGQAAYSAANCFLNALVQHRRARGLPGSSLDLTAVSDSGYLAEDLEKAAEVARNLGSDSICESEVLALLSAAIDGTMASTCNGHTITGMRITATMRPFWTDDAKFKAMRLAAEEEAAAAAAKDASLGARVSFNTALRAAKTRAEAEDVVCRGLVDRIASVLMMEPEELDITRSLAHYPLDSLVAIEIRNFITREFEANMQVLELLSSGSIQTLAKAVCSKSKLVPESLGESAW